MSEIFFYHNSPRRTENFLVNKPKFAPFRVGVIKFRFI